jgi:hypothetical protein
MLLEGKFELELEPEHGMDPGEVRSEGKQVYKRSGSGGG